MPGHSAENGDLTGVSMPRQKQCSWSTADQYFIRVHIEEVKNGQFRATSDELPGLVAQGRTIEEGMEIAQDVARRLLESYQEHGDPTPAGLRRTGSRIDLDIAGTA